MNNVYYVGSGELTFSIIERIINENLKLELAPEAEQRRFKISVNEAFLKLKLPFFQAI